MTGAPDLIDGSLLEPARAAVRKRFGLGAQDAVPADALVQIVARLADIAAARINAGPEKNRMAFLGLIGARQAAPRAARTALAFAAAPGAPATVRIAAGTAAAAPPPPGAQDPVVFETERDLVLLAAAPVAAWVRDPARDRVADLTATLLAAGSAAVDPFAGTTRATHRLLIGAGDALAIGPSQRVTIAVRTAGANAQWPLALRWAWWDGSEWQALRPSAATPTSIVFAAVPAVPEATLGGTVSRWLAATPTSSTPNAGLVAGPATADVTVTSSDLPDGAWADEERLDVTGAFAPFGETGAAEALSLMAEDAFGKPGAAVTLTVELADPQPVAAPGLAIAWEYSMVDGWRTLGITTPGEGQAGETGVHDATAALTQDGGVTFTVPADWRAAPGPGRLPGHWLRIRPQAGGYAVVPHIASLRVGWSWTLPRLADVTVSSTAGRSAPGVAPDAGLVDGVPVDVTKDFLAFGGRPAPGSVLHIASAEALTPPRATVTLTVTVTAARQDTPTATLAWEYWDASAKAWLAPPGLTDTTHALTASGTVSFGLPDTAGPVQVAGRSAPWIRVRVTGGDYGHDARYVADTGSSTGFTLEPSTLDPPSIASLAFSYTQTASTDAPVLLREDDAGITAATPGADGTVQPFVPMPEAEPTLHVAFSAPLPNDAVDLYADASPVDATSSTPPQEVVWEAWDGAAWQALAGGDETAGLTRPGLVGLVGPVRHEPSTDFGVTAWWLRARRTAPGARGEVARLLTNTTWASARTTVAEEVLGSSTGNPGQTFGAARAPVLPGEAVSVLEPEMPPPGELAELGEGALEPAAQGASVWVRWREVFDFLSSGPRSRDYVLDRLQGTIAFGDGRQGLVPPVGNANVRMAYATGGGARGNVGAGAIAQLRTAVAYVKAVTNPWPATGGTDATSLDVVRERGARLLRHRGRAVAAADLEDLALDSSSRVARALAVPPTTASTAGSVGLVVVPASPDPMPVPDESLIEEVRAALRPVLVPTAVLWIAGPGWVQATVSASLTALTADAATTAREAALTALVAFLHPLTGGEQGIGWPFGREPHRSDVLRVLEDLDEVDHVDTVDLTLTPIADAPTPGAFLVTSGAHEITLTGIAEEGL